MASYREGRPRTSIAWEHFEIKDRLRSIATCNHCHESFSFRTSVSNLMKHLKVKHGFVKDEEINESTDAANDNKLEETKTFKSELWQHYEIKDEFLKLATCNLCHEPFSYQNTSVLTKHLKKKHAIDGLNVSEQEHSEEDSEEEKVDTSQNGTDSAESRRNRSSAAWEFFEIKDPHNKIATCTVCGAKCSYKASVSNLTKHARRKHGLGPFRSSSIGKSDDEQDVSDGEQNNTTTTSVGTMMRAQRSIVWLYFKCVDPESKYSQCLICKKILSHSTTLTNLKKHLARKHPDVKIPEREDGRKRILLSTGGELFEVETTSKLDDDDNLAHGDDDAQHNQTVEMDTVYLEDFEGLDASPPKKKCHMAKTENSKLPIYESSSEEEITFSSKYSKKKCDSLDHFGKYLVSLLRKLPPDASNSLQADFVKQIMAVQPSDAPIAATDKYSTATNIFDQKNDKIN